MYPLQRNNPLQRTTGQITALFPTPHQAMPRLKRVFDVTVVGEVDHGLRLEARHLKMRQEVCAVCVLCCASLSVCCLSDVSTQSFATPNHSPFLSLRLPPDPFFHSSFYSQFCHITFYADYCYYIQICRFFN